MAKKKAGPNDPFKGMENMFSQFSPEEMERALAAMKEMVTKPGAYEDIQNQQFYAYSRPDYAAQCKPVCEALLPLYRAQHPREVLNALHAALPAIGKMGAKELMKHGCTAIEEIEDNDVEEFLEKVATYEEEHPDGEDDDEGFPDDSLPFFDDSDFDDNGCPSWLTSPDNVKDYHLQVTLKDSPIPVTRELTVPSTTEMGVFEIILTMAMGWEGRHLSSFKAGKKEYMAEEYMDEEAYDRYELLDDQPLANLLARKGSSMTWEYDFGDGWMHEIKVIASTPHPNDEPYRITLVAAENACPPEDCGGVWGYRHMLDVLADKKHPDYKMMKEWAPCGFKPDKVDRTAIQQKMDMYLEY